MNITKDISPLTEFKRDSARLIAQIKETGRPQILTVNGKAEIVIQSAKAYEEMVDLLGTLEKIARAAKEHDEGKGIPVDAFFSGFEKKHGLKRDAIQG